MMSPLDYAFVVVFCLLVVYVLWRLMMSDARGRASGSCSYDQFTTKTKTVDSSIPEYQKMMKEGVQSWAEDIGTDEGIRESHSKWVSEGSNLMGSPTRNSVPDHDLNSNWVFGTRGRTGIANNDNAYQQLSVDADELTETGITWSNSK
jgi:hypothetical protein